MIFRHRLLILQYSTIAFLSFLPTYLLICLLNYLSQVKMSDDLVAGTTMDNKGYLYPFTLHSGHSKGLSVTFAAETNEQRLAWSQLLDAQSRYLATMALCGDCPPKRCSTLKKMDKVMVFETFHNYYFVLDFGSLKYFRQKSEVDGDETGEGLRGMMILGHVSIQRAGRTRIILTADRQYHVHDRSDHEMTLETTTSDEADVWLDDLMQQAAFATSNAELIHCDDQVRD
jgi:hypothetical protein